MSKNGVPYLICELANSHAGDPQTIRELIREFGALDHPAKGIKFQAFSPDGIAMPDFSWYSVYEELCFDAATWTDLIAEASALGDVWIDVFDIFGVEVIRDNLEKIRGLKLQASVTDNHEVIAALGRLDLSDKVVIANVSGFDLGQVDLIVDRFEQLAPHLVLQVGFQNYPTGIEDTALQKLGVLRAKYPQLELCMADHSPGGSDFSLLAPVYASLLGCTYVEKHFCLDRETAKYDGSAALEPAEMALLCQRLRDAAQASRGPFVNRNEAKYLASSIQTPLTLTACAPGELLRPENLKYRRTPLTGISWTRIQQLQAEGLRLSRAVPADATLTEADFAPARVAAVVACRMKSSRLPRKALLPIAGVPSVERCLAQFAAAPSVQKVVLATSTVPEDAVLSEHTLEGQVFWAGDPDDVITRYLGACEEYGIDVIVRVTADCPTISPEIIETLLAAHHAAGADYTAAVDAAVGTACEVIEASALREVVRRLGHAKHSEYMTWYFRNNADHFRVNLVDLPADLVRGYRLTLDYPEDLELFEGLYREAGLTDKREPLSLRTAIEILDAHPEIASLNEGLALRYRTDEALIEMLNRETRIPAEDNAS